MYSIVWCCLLVLSFVADAAVPLRGNCKVGRWGQWSSCSSLCGPGEKTRTRQITHNGTDCPTTTETSSCTGSCNTNCEMSDWSKWSPCSASCGSGGTTTRTRTLVWPTGNQSHLCPETTEREACNQFGCPVDCVVGRWSKWSICSYKGFHTRTRKILVRPIFGGLPCPKDVSEDEPCKPGPMSCEVAQWGSWGPCSSNCTGEQSRTRMIVKSGFDCPQTIQKQLCGSCVRNCIVGRWSKWGPCSVECGGGKEIRTRKIKQVAANGGKPCPTTNETHSCNQQHCP
eukprot:TRINITY_DN84223_c0_g1_i1.p1 TRINITY_DN84223_c0_g1~~TRINITY_DN84223_c0_g1_i1.p1  ORF type:complete len:291 (-),score=-7.27 TRINITY_DN84223_c0_g1_i1:84-935(-)